MGLSVDFDAWPLVQIVHHGKRRSIDDASAMIDAIRAALDRRERFAVVYDSTELRAPERDSNEILTAFVEKRREELTWYCAGIGYFITEPKLLAAIRKAEEAATPEQRAAMPMPTKTYDTWEQARAWAEAQLQEPTT